MAGVLTDSPSKIMQNSIIGSPIRPLRMMPTPVSPGLGDFYPWKWSESARNVELSPSSSCGGSPPFDRGMCRGRPRAEMIAELRKAGSEISNGAIHCKICQRIFPREKSLQAHLRTHTGERPYKCDYPDCGRAFVQSGQLKTHQRLHTGEKPFACSVPGCQSRFTHANRHCPEHPYAGLRRETTQVQVEDVIKTDENSEEVAKWLQRYANSQQKSKAGSSPSSTSDQTSTSTMTTPKSSRHRSSSSSSSNPRKRLRTLSESALETTSIQDSETETNSGNSDDGATPKRQRRRPSVRRLIKEQEERLMGAMALIELAQNSASLVMETDPPAQALATHNRRITL